MNFELLICESAKKFTDTPLVIMNDKETTFSEVECLSRKMSESLKGLGLKKGDRVTIGLPNGPEIIISFLAVTRIGCIVVPLNPLMKEKELRYIFQDSQASAAITYHKHSTIIKSLKARGKDVPQHIISIDSDTDTQSNYPYLSYESMVSIDSNHETNTSHMTSKDDLALIAYTSGTTGKPKGVMLSHLNLISVASAVAKAQDRDSTDKTVCFFPMTHITGIVNYMVDSMITGATIILQDHFNCEDYLQKFHDYKCTTMGGVSAVFQAVLTSPALSRFDFSRLCRITSGGTSLPNEIYNQLSERFQVPIIEMYGMTENSATLTSNPLSKQKIGSVGIPLPGMKIKIVDEKGCPLPFDTIGEVVAKGPGIMKGYYNHSKQTQKVLRNGWYHTGDMGKLDTEGFLYIVDRKDDMINAGAYKIYPREVEEVLYTHPALLDCAVVGRPDDRLGQIPVAHVVLRSGKAATDPEIIDYVKSKIANYKAPRKIVYHESLPRSPQGKILKNGLT